MLHINVIFAESWEIMIPLYSEKKEKDCDDEEMVEHTYKSLLIL